jgi:hypothetical protein
MLEPGSATRCYDSRPNPEEKPRVSAYRLIIVFALAACLLPQVSYGQSEEVKPAQDQILGTRAALAPDRPELIWLERGAEIRQSPEWDASVIAIVDIRVQVPIGQEQDDWLLIRYAGWKGWVHRTGEREVEIVVPFSTAPDQKMLERALAALRIAPDESATNPDAPAQMSEREQRTLGPFTLYTDLPESKLLTYLDKVAWGLLKAYATRYGLDPGNETLEAVILFNHDEDYRTFAQTIADAPDAPIGHATQGVAVVSVGYRARDEVAAVLVHELTHLLNRRVFREIEVPWLDEGMANDLAYCQIKRWSGEIDLGTLGGRSVVIERPVYLAGGQSRVDREVRLEGPVASLSLLRESSTQLPLDLLFDLSPSEFMDPHNLRTRYDQSTFLIRYLLDSGDAELAMAFHAFLRYLAEHEANDSASDLAAHAELDIDRLNEGYSDWLQARRRH